MNTEETRFLTPKFPRNRHLKINSDLEKVLNPKSISTGRS